MLYTQPTILLLVPLPLRLCDLRPEWCRLAVHWLHLPQAHLYPTLSFISITDADKTLHAIHELTVHERFNVVTVHGLSLIHI